MKKKQLLFVIDSLDIAGAEKSLVSLLSMLDYSQYSVDLQLFSYGNPLEELLPKDVNVLRPIKYTTFAQKSLIKSIKYGLTKQGFLMLQSRVKYSMGIYKRNFHNTKRAIVYWKSVSKVIETNPKLYDVAISYAQGVPTYYVAEKVNAKVKYAWVNAIYSIDKDDIEYQKNYYNRFNRIIAVSDSVREELGFRFPYYKNKIKVIYDINNPDFINRMANIGGSFSDIFDGIRILTVGRLTSQKGFDIALESCKKLKEKDIHFKWYVLGKGPLKSEIEQYIKEHGLSEHFILLGVKTNPYPYFRDADLYVQTSKFEGFGLAIAEARMLNVPVVTTRFDAVFNQMIHEKNGLVVDINADAISDAILRVINDNELKGNIINYLQKEKKGNPEEIEKFYSLIEQLPIGSGKVV
ncbi:glycosyltransferase [Oceanobacillus piezotolerans]|uniref:Glycosyltransferase n=1 Tax=Oceanobacillus piezotolerans TaxID=2448030 RepID=A0A498DFI6_9BACI|nr:glycosyltransferase [Oceanobacillus piezotolerans]RLL42768.1 glycosyltransferase [Oceanobacillus piezotolerans]